jgi:hypothetical protein
LISIFLLMTCCLAFFAPIGGLISVILGRSARRQIRTSDGRERGEGLATAGEVIGWINIAIGLLGVLVFVLFIVLSLAAGSGGANHVLHQPSCFGC